MAAYTGESSNFLSHTFEVVNTALNNFVTNFSADIASEIAPIVGLGLTLSFIIVGIMAVRGLLDRPFQEVAWKMFVFGIITSVALTSAVYQQYVIDVFLTLPDELITSVIANNLSGQNVATGQNAAQAIEQLYSAGSYNAGLYFNEAGMTNLPPILYGCMVWAGTVMCVLMGTLWLFISKIVLSLMLAVGPIFIMALCWQNTRQYFFSWLNVVLNTVITTIFVVAVFAIFSSVFQEGLNNLEVSNDSEGFMNAAVYAFLGLMCMGVLMLIPQYVSQLTGAAAGAVGSAMAGIAGKISGGASSVASGGVNTVRAGFASNSAKGAYQSARESGASRFQSARHARHEYNKSMAEMKQGYPDYFRKTKSRE